MMSKKKMSLLNIVLTVIVAIEFVFILIMSLGIWRVRTTYYTPSPYSKGTQKEKHITFRSVTAIKELSKEDVLVKHIMQERAEEYHYFLCTIEVENEGNESVDYINLEAKNQNDDFIPCYSFDYYQDIMNASEGEENNYKYGKMVVPEYSTSQYNVILALREEQMKDMEELTICEWTYEQPEETPNEVSCIWKDVLTSSPVQ